MQRLQGLWEALPQIPTPSYSLARRVGARTTLPDDALSDPSSGRWLHVEIVVTTGEATDQAIDAML